MDDIKMGINEQTGYNINNDRKERLAFNRQKIGEHARTIHYRQYIVGLIVICIVTITAIGWITVNRKNDNTEIKKMAGYETSGSIGDTALVIFNQIDAIAHKKDDFFHQPGKVYTIKANILFNKYDTIYHVLDNGYHRSITTEEKLRRAEKIGKFIKAQDILFASTQYTNLEEDKVLKQLNGDFLAKLGGFKLDGALSGLDIKTIKEASKEIEDLLTGDNAGILTGIKEVLTGLTLSQIEENRINALTGNIKTQ